MKKNLLLALIGTLLIGATGCGSESGQATSTASTANASTNTEAQSTEEYGNTDFAATKSYLEYANVEALPNNADAKKVKIAYGYSGYPISYTTNTGDASGYDIEVLKAVDALLPDYEFEFVPSQGGDDLLLGVQTGKFDGAVRNWFQTEERRQIFTFPQENIGLSVTGLTVRKDELDKIYDFASLSAAGGRLVPVDPGDGHYTVLKKWTEANPDKAWDFETGSLANIVDAYSWVAEGRYDAYFGLEVIFNHNVLADEGPASQYKDQLVWTPCAAIPTYVIFSQEDKDVADAFDSVINTIWESGYPGFLQSELYGVNYIEQYGRDGLGFNK